MSKKHPPSKAQASLPATRPKIPQPVFPARLEVTVSKPFVKASKDLLVNWPATLKEFVFIPPTADNLRKLIVAEVQTRNRPTMLRRLLSRLHIVERQELMKVLKIN